MTPMGSPDVDDASEQTRAQQFDELLSLAKVEADRKRALGYARRAYKVAARAQDPRRMRSALQVQAIVHRKWHEFDEARRAFEAAYGIAESSDDATGMAMALHGMAAILTDTGRWPETLALLERALPLAEAAANPVVLGHIHHGLGSYHQLAFDAARAIEHLTIAARHFQEGDYTPGECVVLNSLAFLYGGFNDLERAEECSRRVIERCRQTGATPDREWIQNLADTLHRKGDLDEALKLNMEALEEIERSGNSHMEDQILASVGSIYTDRGEHQRALDFYERAYRRAIELGSVQLWVSQASLGVCHAQLGNHERAVELLLGALAEAERMKNREAEYQIHEVLALSYEALGDDLAALKHHRLYASIRDEIIGAEQQRALRQMELQAESERAERERQQLEWEREKLEREMERKGNELAAMALQMIEKNRFIAQLKAELKDASRDADPASRKALKGLASAASESSGGEHMWETFQREFDSIHQGFNDALERGYPVLTATERKICMLLKLGMRSKEMADLLSISESSVEIYRHRVRKKLGLQQGETFTAFFSKLVGE